jgi:hypothetical protein
MHPLALYQDIMSPVRLYQGHNKLDFSFQHSIFPGYVYVKALID